MIHAVRGFDLGGFRAVHSAHLAEERTGVKQVWGKWEEGGVGWRGTGWGEAEIDRREGDR